MFNVGRVSVFLRQALYCRFPQNVLNSFVIFRSEKDSIIGPKDCNIPMIIEIFAEVDSLTLFHIFVS